MREGKEVRQTDIPMSPEFRNFAALVKNPLWKQLTDKQKKFVEVYLDTDKDHLAATRGSHTVQTEESANSIGLRLLKHPAIRQLLGLFYGYDLEGGLVNRSEFLLLLADRLRDVRTPSSDWKSLAQMYRAMRGWKLRNPPAVGRPKENPTEDKSVKASDLDEMVRRMEAEGNKS